MVRTIAIAHDCDFATRDQYYLSDPAKIHVDPATNSLRLRKQADGTYPSPASYYARGPAISASALVRWKALSVQRALPAEYTGAGTTAIAFRLNNGTSDYYWSGTAWTVAAGMTGTWNTLAELQGNIAAFPTASKTLRMVYRLITSNGAYTPVVWRVSTIYEVELPSFEDAYLLRTLIARLKTLRPEADLVAAWSTTGTTLDLNTLQYDEGIGEGVAGFSAVTAVYDHTMDPDHGVNLYLSFNSTTKVVTTSSPIVAGRKVIVRVRYTPITALLTHPDYNEIAGAPAILIDALQERLVAEAAGGEACANEVTNVAIEAPSPRQLDYEFTIRMIAGRVIDVLRLVDAVTTDIRGNPVVSCPVVGLRADLTVTEPMSMSPVASLTHTPEATIRVRLRSCEHWIFPARMGYGVGQVHVGGDFNATL